MHRKASWVTSWTGTWRAPSFEPSRMFDENITRKASDRAISTHRWACSSRPSTRNVTSEPDASASSEAKSRSAAPLIATRWAPSWRPRGQWCAVVETWPLPASARR